MNLLPSRLIIGVAVLIANEFQAALSIAANVLKKPNIVIIVSDDHGFGDIGWNNAEVKTPNLSQLANDGVRLDRFYVNPICSVTRAALMTGIATLKTGVNNSSGLDLKFRIMPQAFQKAGYQTWMCGKWHLGGPEDYERHGPEYLPHNRGFDYFYGHLHGAVDYYKHERKDLEQLDWQRNGKPVIETGFSTDLLANDAIRLLTARDMSRPFFLYLAFNAVHGPLQSPPGIANLSKRDKRQILLANLTYMDVAIGRLLTTIREQNLDASTVVLFFGDNGGQLSQGASNGSLRGEKGVTFEGGIRVPAVIRWTDALKPSISQQFASVMDVYPTLCSLAGIPCEQSQPLDGIDLFPALKRGTVAPHPAFVMGNKDLSCFEEPWKLVFDPKGDGTKLFNIIDDPNEQLDVASRNPEIVKKLTSIIESQGGSAKKGGGKGKKNEKKKSKMKPSS